MNIRSWLRSFWKSQTLWLAVLVPLLAAPLPIIYPNSIAKCGYCVIVIGFFWVTEIIPLAATSLLPVFMFPVLGVMPAKDVCTAYFKDTLMLFLGSLIVAVAVEKWNLHKRLALRTLTLVGPQPKWLLMGVMLPTWFLSMWMSNTATTAMMMPIVSAILTQIKSCQAPEEEHDAMIDEDGNITIVVGVENSHSDIQLKETLEKDFHRKETPPKKDSNKEFEALAKTFALATAYSANVGGVATITGTPPNVIFKGLADKLFHYHHATNPVNFANWALMGIPLAFFLVFFLWLWMQFYSQGVRCLMFWRRDTTSYERVRDSLRREYHKLGPMSFAEILVTANFVLLALLWITRKPGFMPGWDDLFRKEFVGDSTPAILISVLLFILPARPPAWMGCCRTKSLAVSEALDKLPVYEPLLDWKIVNQKLAWGVILLMGGGFALADGCEVSGLSDWVSRHLEVLMDLPTWVIAFMLSVIVAVITEFTSNSPTTTLFVPIVGELAVKIGVHPLYFMIPCTIAASLAFLLPVATPPNAIVFASGYLKVKDMFLAGLPVNIFAIIFLNFALNTWFAGIYDLFTFPEEFLAGHLNSTLNSNTTATLMPYLTNTSVSLTAKGLGL